MTKGHLRDKRTYPAGKCVAPAMACLLSARGRGQPEYTKYTRIRRIFGEAINGQEEAISPMGHKP